MIEEVGDSDEETDIGEAPELSFVTQGAHGVLVATVADFLAAKQNMLHAATGWEKYTSLSADHRPVHDL